MGCDIHSRVEIYRERYAGNGFRWVLMDDEIFENSYYDPASTYAPFRERYTSCPLSDRNYTLFALLADVRNGRGFAGITTGDPITPLDQPRGVPSNASHGWMEEVEQWDVDMHSHTWFTLRELLEPNPLYDQRLVRTGAIRGDVYEKLVREGGRPDGWSGSISGPNIITISTVEYDNGLRAEPFTLAQIEDYRKSWLTAAAKRGVETEDETLARFDEWVNESRTYVQYVWEDSLRESTGELHEMIAALKRYADNLPPLARVGEEGHDGKPIEDKPGWYGTRTIPYDNLRVVIGFDN